MDLDQLVSRASVYSKFLGDKLKDRQEQLKKRKEPGASVEFGKQPDNIVGQMRDYQITGMQWLISLYENGLNGILGDEMGLGKTLQTIAFLAHLVQVGIRGPFLIVAPLSTLRNWEQEFSKFAPSIEVAFYHGSIEERKELRSTRLKQKKGKMQCAVVLTSFEIVMNDKKHLQTIPWKYIVVDEGHRLKNLNCKLIKDLKAYKSANRLLLTGTPLQNNLAELWSLLNFLMPEIFSDLQDFENWFEDIKQLQAENAESKLSLVSTLHEILKPFLLRRVKSDVVLDLLNKKEYILYAPLTSKQKELYDAILRGDIRTVLLKHFANSGVGNENSPVNSASDEQEFDPSILPFQLKSLISNQSLSFALMQLRKACNHPFLFDLGDNLDDEIYSKYLVEWSGKMKLLDRLLPRLLNDNHKVLIFSQFTTMLDLISNYLALKQIACCRIDGAVSLTDRQDQIRDFTEDPALKVFLLSTKAGGLGINLVAADTVIIFDSDWNPQNDLQAQDRCHRIGQTKQVLVYRLISQNSVEKRMLESANEKRSLERTVIHKSQFKGSKKYYQSKSSIVDLKAIFEEEATAINLQQGESHADSVLTDEQLDRILDRTSDFVKDPSIALVGAVEDVHSSIVTR